MNYRIPEITLNDGLTVPAIGLGTYSLRGEEGVNAMLAAIDAGYRLIDSAFSYENEGAVGQAVKRSPVAREELRICSKLPGRHHAYKEALLTIEESLYRAGLDYYDLYLIHWPNPKKGLYVEAWQALIEAKKRGYIRSIGVSNFLPEYLERLIQETGVTPSMNQVELHPRFNQAEQRQAHEAYGIITESWSPLGQGKEILQNEKITAIAEAHGKSPAQVILRWHIQLGALPIPKSGSLQRQQENLNVFDFELTAEEMEMLSSLSRPDGRIWGQDPSKVEE